MGGSGGQVGVEQRFVDEIRSRLSGSGDLTPEDVQTVFTSAVHLYLLASNAGEKFPPLRDDTDLTVTDLVITVTEAMEQANIEIFELGMWATWGHADR